MPRVDDPAFSSFARCVGPRVCLQAVCIRVLACLHGVLARRWAYSRRVLVHEGSCLQAERMSFASRYTYTGVIPAERHKAITKKARKTNHIERFNNTLRQRVSRLVRETLASSQKLVNHIGAVKYFICHDNLTRATAAALPV